MPLLARQEKRKTDEIAPANAPHDQQLSEPRRRPYLLKMLQDGLGTRVLADTLDWDGEFRAFFSPSRARGVRHLPGVSSRPVGNGETEHLIFP